MQYHKLVLQHYQLMQLLWQTIYLDSKVQVFFNFPLTWVFSTFYVVLQSMIYFSFLWDVLTHVLIDEVFFLTYMLKTDVQVAAVRQA